MIDTAELSYRRFSLSKELQDVVKYVWVMKSNAITPTEYDLLIPDAYPEIIFVISGAYNKIGIFDTSKPLTIRRPGNGVYAFIIDGDVTIEGQKLNKRDGFGVWDTNQLDIIADSNAKVLLMDVPMRM